MVRVQQVIASVLVAVATAQPYNHPPPYSQGPQVQPVPYSGPPANRLPGSYGPPSPYKPSPPYPKATKPKRSHKEPCCLNHKLNPTVHHGYGYSRKPKLNTLLFDQCPLHKDDESICEAAAKKFAKYGTALSVKKDYKPKKIKLDYKPKYKVDNARPYSAVEASSYKTVMHPAIVKGDWYSDTNADLVAIGRGCCYNIYGGVKFGDKLDTECTNSVVGDPDELYLLVKYSVVTPGNLNLFCIGNVRRLEGNVRMLKGPTSCDFVHPVIVGRDLRADPNIFIDTLMEDVGQFWNGISLQVGKNIEPPIDATIGIGDGLFQQYVNGVGGDRVVTTGMKETISGTEVAESRLAAETRICAFSDQLKSQEETVDCVLKTDGMGDKFLEIICTDAAAQNCVTNCEKDKVEEADDVVIMSPGSQVIINVDGEVVNMELEAYTVSADNISVIWNFHKAVTLRIIANSSNFRGSVVAPRALSLNIGAITFEGAILNGAPDSTTTLDVVQEEETPYPDPFPLAPQEPEITLCTCLCEEKDCDHSAY